MRENNLIIKNYIQKSHLNPKVSSKLSSKYKKIIKQINDKKNASNQFFSLLIKTTILVLKLKISRNSKSLKRL